MNDLQSTWKTLALALAEEEGHERATILLLASIQDMLGDMAERLARVEGRTR